VADFLRNGWPESIGIGGRLRPQSAAGIERNTQAEIEWFGISTQEIHNGIEKLVPKHDVDIKSEDIYYSFFRAIPALVFLTENLSPTEIPRFSAIGFGITMLPVFRTVTSLTSLAPPPRPP
jgi:hypothetical protein